ncbi:ArnT family glycosyltransferase, partial [Edaphovirga cremea]|uniref:ArnT family glycosyltransferase n=1 Tax=Edaphovirga cremea TaxID=2267246 RepID=UPI003988DA8F
MRRLLQGGVTLSPPRLILLDAAALLTILVVTLLLQWASGAYSSAFGAEPDESSHYVTGVMVRDYIVRGLPGNPVTFAKDFYLHYPRVAFGIWPPLFNVFSGLWMLPFGTGRISVLFLLAALTAIWSFIFYKVARPVLGRPGAMVSALLLVFLPTTQKSTSAVMVEIPVAVMMLLAMGAYARYLERERTADAFKFGLYAAVALLVKYNAMALALLPPLCVVITGRYYLWRSRNFWLPAAVVLLVAGPWYVVMHRLVLYAAEPGGRAPIGPSIAANAKGIILIAG